MGVALPVVPAGGAGVAVVPLVAEEPALGAVVVPAFVEGVVVLPEVVALLPVGDDELGVEEDPAGCCGLVVLPWVAVPVDWLGAGAGVADGEVCALEGGDCVCCVEPDEEPVWAAAAAASAANAKQARAIMMRLHAQAGRSDPQLAYGLCGGARIDRSPGCGACGGTGASYGVDSTSSPVATTKRDAML